MIIEDQFVLSSNSSSVARKRISSLNGLCPKEPRGNGFLTSGNHALVGGETQRTTTLTTMTTKTKTLMVEKSDRNPTSNNIYIESGRYWSIRRNAGQKHSSKVSWENGNDKALKTAVSVLHLHLFIT